MKRKTVIWIVLCIAFGALIIYLAATVLLRQNDNRNASGSNDNATTNMASTGNQEETLEANQNEGWCPCEELDNGSDITAALAKAIIEVNPNVVILDVRTAEEFAEGHIENAVLLPVETLSEHVAEVLPNKGQLILVYCRSGRRSGEAVKEMLELGYQNVHNFGGIIDWPYEIVQ